MRQQAGFREKLRKAGPYPYSIKAVVCPDRAECNGLDPWAVLEFIRIEALLRSATVHAFYNNRAGSGQDSVTDKLGKVYGVWYGWNSVKGLHHELISNSSVREKRYTYKGDADEEEEPHIGIYDIGKWLRKEKPALLEESVDIFRYMMVKDARQPTERHLWLRIDTHTPKKFIDKFLKNRLTKSRRLEQIDHHSRYQIYGSKLPPIYGHSGLKTWIDYFRCYDHVRLNPSASFGDAGKVVYGTPSEVKNNLKNYERAEQAVKRVHRLIVAAEEKNWPPPSSR